MKKTIIALSTVALLASCGGEQSKQGSTSKSEKPQEPVCKYEYNYLNSTIGFGGFKTTDKKEVKGVFDKFEITNTKKSETLSGVFENADFAVITKSVNTQNTDRDYKLANNFFGTMINTDTISGSVKSIDASKGEILLDFKINNVAKEITLSYEESGDTVRLGGVLDLVTFEAQPAVEALNKVCYDLHKGLDGVSKTWPEANIYVESVLNKDCK